MGYLFDRLMVRPSRMDLAAALVEAQAAANAAQPALEHPHSVFLQAVIESAGSGEGFREWNGQRYCDASGIALVWWTDHARQRRFRILGRRWTLNGFQPGPDLITRGNPPVWFFSGTQCFRVGSEWRVVCACGEAGPPERLGWMGTRCGPCHDREQFGEPLPQVARVGPAPPGAEEETASNLSVRIEEARRLVVERPGSGDDAFTHEFADAVPNGELFGWRPWALLADDDRSLALFLPTARMF
ncbi:MAG: hypothetical protein K2W96_10685, partial [Gemmataceae bacterium]|nr:hypothetical protein [Gemmataceae bacterium]